MVGLPNGCSDTIGESYPITIRGRRFTSDDLSIVKECVEEYYEKGRTRISEVVCERLGWRQPNGWLKDRACRDTLLRLERKGLIKLPPPLSVNQGHPKREKKEKDVLADYNFDETITDFPREIVLRFAKGDKSESVWNKFVDRYHYLGHKVVVGRCIKYLVLYDEDIVAALSFSSPAWGLASRDAILPLMGIDVQEIQDLVINNSRFAMAPNIRVPNLASTILSVATDRVVRDWSDYYSITPQVAETFIEPSKFSGTCYKAANWIDIGETQGYAKKGGRHHNSQTPKRVLLYGLNRARRRHLHLLAKQAKEGTGT